MLYVWSDEKPLALDVAVVTASTQATLPDLGRYGLSLRSNEVKFWEVFSSGPYGSVDELAGEGRMRPADGLSYETITGYRKITTAP